MIRTDSLYEVCHELFAGYPLAVEAINGSGVIRSMVLMLQDGDDARFFVPSTDRSEGRASFSIFPWRASGIVDIEPHGGAVPDVVANALTRGVPIPRDGSLFGWACEEAVTALVGVQARYTPASSVPSWAVMPLASIEETQWPPFTSERLFGNWFWEYHRARKIVLLDALIAGTSGLVFWVDTTAILGSECCAVARDIRSAEGYTLGRGCYVHYEALRVGKPVPSLAVLLADPGKTDLALQFQRSGHGDSWLPDES